MKKLHLTFFLILLALIPVLQAEKTAPRKSFKPGEIWADDKGVHINAHSAGILMDKGTYYWFGEHKIAGIAGNKAEVGVHCYSSKDLYNWKDEGIALKVVENDPEHPITKGCILERPKVIYNKKTRKYVMWFHLERKGHGYSSAFSGVATSDKPTGPYTFIRAGRANVKQWPQNMPDAEKTLENKPETPHLQSSAYPKGMNPLAFFKRDFEKGQMARDMTLFVDDDGKAYHIYSSEENGTLHIAELTDDYLNHSGKFVRLFEGRFMEAPALLKRKGKYYFIGSGCTGWYPNKARSAVADSIMGPWKELENPCRGEKADSTFGAQSTYILKVPGKEDAYIFMADIWRPDNAIDGRYVWLPIEFEGDQMRIDWKDEWTLDHFKADKKAPAKTK